MKYVPTLSILGAYTTLASNPLTPGPYTASNPGGIADPHMHVFPESDKPDRVYVYATHDEIHANDGQGGCCTGEWWIWGSDDLVHWEEEATLPPLPWEDADSYSRNWATDCVYRDGYYFWYVSIGAKTIGVVKSDTPVGPWESPLDLPMVNTTLVGIPDGATDTRDPGTFVDPLDNQFYLVYGACSQPDDEQPLTGCYWVSLLSDDMISTKEVFKLDILDAMGPYGSGKADDKPYLHFNDGLYYLSWGCFYATSDNVRGPYQYQGSIIDAELLDPEFRVGNLTQEPWYTQDDYQDRHGSFLNFKNQWYFFSNDRSHSTVPFDEMFRNAVGSYVHYNDNGTIAPIQIDATGVGMYDGQKAIQAENYFFMEEGEKREHVYGREFHVRTSTEGGPVSLYYPKINISGREASAIKLFVENLGADGGSVIVTKGSCDSDDADVIAKCTLERTDTDGGFEKQSFQLGENVAGDVDLCLRMTGSAIKLDKFEIV